VKLRGLTIYLAFAFIIILASCSKHQQIMKSPDNEMKYAAAMDYFEKNDYARALQLFQQLINFYKGTEKAEKLQYYYAFCHYKQKDYILASYYFKRFAQNYPRSEYSEEANFLSAYCYYLDSPKSSLDQTNTIQAINELQLFTDLYPESERVEEARELILELQDKLLKKDFDIAKLYYKMERYEAAITSFNNLLKDYPDSEYKEDILYYIFKSYFSYTLKSIRSKQEERYQAALDSYNEFVFQFPESEYKKEVDNMKSALQRRMDK
jgi:outer membrane protein assembly factor BamD